MNASHGLRRDLGLLDAVGVGFGAIVGAGIFVVTGVAAGVAGPAFTLALMIAAVAATANALSSAQLAASYPQAGGTYEYGYRLLGPRTGFVAGWMFLASKVSAAGAVAIGLAAYLDPFVAGVNPRAIAVLAVLSFTGLNYFGIRRSSRVNLAIVGCSVGALVVFVVTGVAAFREDNVVPYAPGGLGGTLEAAALIFFAYTGYARIATLGEEVRDPKRVIPRAVMITVGGAVVLYVAVGIVAVGAVGAEALARTPAPLRVAAESFSLPWVPVVVSIGGLAAMLGVILSQVLALSRMVFAMGRRGDLPRRFAEVDPRHGVPRFAVLLVGCVAAAVALTGTLEGVARAASLTILVYYFIANLSALRMPVELRMFPAIVPGTGLVACALLALSLDLSAIAAGALILVCGLLVRAVVRRGGRERRS
jgi:APA family basic amino acid/polyamine antiporter